MRSDGSVMMPGERAQHEERAQHDDEPARRSAAEPRREGVGPQGAALILELEARWVGQSRSALNNSDSLPPRPAAVEIRANRVLARRRAAPGLELSRLTVRYRWIC